MILNNTSIVSSTTHLYKHLMIIVLLYICWVSKVEVNIHTNTDLGKDNLTWGGGGMFFFFLSFFFRFLNLCRNFKEKKYLDFKDAKINNPH